MKYTFLLVLVFTACAHQSTHSTDRSLIRKEVAMLPGWSKWTIAKTDGTTLDIFGVVDEVKRPVVVMLIGSRCQPLFQLKGGAVTTPLLEKDAQFFRSRGFHTVALERRGIKSFEPLPEAIQKLPGTQRCSESYGGLTKSDRIEDSRDAIVALSREPWFGDLILMGHSEGGDVISGLSNKLKGLNIKALGFFAGAGNSLFYNFILRGRKGAASKNVAEVFENLIWITSSEANGKFGGYPYARMKSFAIDSTPLDDVLKNDIPIFIANGSRDEKEPIEDADAFAVEVLRKQPLRPIRYVNYMQLNHDLENKQGVDEGRETLADFLAWVKKPEPARSFQLK